MIGLISLALISGLIKCFLLFILEHRTNRKVLLILDNALGHVETDFFSCKPMDMGIIAALKRRYKYHLIREILSYPDNTEIVKIHLEDATKHMKRGSIGLALGNSAHLLDVVNLIVIAWNDIKLVALLCNCNILENAQC